MAENIKNKIRQLYSFLREANQLRFRPVRLLADQPKVVRVADMPDNPIMQIFRPVPTDEGNAVPEVIMRIGRPKLTKCPSPPESIVSWLMPNWDDPAKEISVAVSQNAVNENGETITVRFAEDPQRNDELKIWASQRRLWAEPELSARRAMSYFEDFYDIYTAIEKDGEDLELLAADGHLLWSATSGRGGSVLVQHPILLKRVELRFEPTIPEFTIHETDREAELYTSLFTDLQGIEPAAILSRKTELESVGYHPFGYQDTDAFLKSFIQTISPIGGEFLTDSPATGPTITPRIYRDMVIILRKRNAGIANAIDSIIDDIDQKENFSRPLAQITGTVDDWVNTGLGSSTDAEDPGRATEDATDIDNILLAKEANKEQAQIIRRLDRSNSVIVQGPPGTGKTHTIGNLIGHLLACGKSVLVVAQTEKALKVLRENVPEGLRPLAVSVLGSDQNARQQLKSAVDTITERLTSNSAASLIQKSHSLELNREALIGQLSVLKAKLRESLDNEYRDIEAGEERLTPSDAARFVSANSGNHSWIPSPISIHKLPNLSEDELIRLYAIGVAFSPQEERDARQPLPDLSTLPSERQFQMMVSDYEKLTTMDLTPGMDTWCRTDCGSEDLAKVGQEIALAFSRELKDQTWRPYAIVAGIHGGGEQDVWERLIATIDEAVHANSKYSLCIRHQPRLSETMPVQKQLQISNEICAHLEAGGNLGFVQLAYRPEWRQLIKTTSVTAGRPNHRDHFEAISCLAKLENLRTSLQMPWDIMIGNHVLTPFRELGATPEMSCRALVPEIRRCLEWHNSLWLPCAENLRSNGLKIDDLLAGSPPEASQISEYLAIERLATLVLPTLIQTEVCRRKLHKCEEAFEDLADLAAQADTTSADKGCITGIIEAVSSRDTEHYSASISYCRRLHSLVPIIAERDGLLRKLEMIAPAWAEQIKQHLPPHDKREVPGDVATAWKWRQLYDTIAERDKLDSHDLQRQIDQKRRTLRHVTVELIDASAWGKQLLRIEQNNSIRQALVGWLDTTRRLLSTRQIDGRTALLREARNLMKQCVSAVPVWIMPISIMAESFDPRTTHFDVVIIDEASQADLNALIPLYLADQVVVVGDNEQVEPLGVGKNTATMANLRKSMLQGIPNSHLFDNMSSIYDIGRQSFGDAIRLVEHFRCVPEIIAFSNLLSYEGKIRPLRESNSTKIKPACVSRRINGIREGDVNKAEAKFIVDIINAMIQHPLYVGKEIGIISMIGKAQAVLIEELIKKEVPIVEKERRNIRAGISSDFQGDQRDIILLSMVDSPSGDAHLRTIGDGAFELFKKRYNVATSRARDQMWVIHSFDPDFHLRAGDLRFKLLQHVKDPSASIRLFEQESGKTESPFEMEVLKRLVNAGYQVKTQWQVGHYRIDMVVEGAGKKRLAVECDGDRYHTLDNLADDMERQTVLERLGWQFIRIRGSKFFRDPDSTMRPVFDTLTDLGIMPQGTSSSDATQNMDIINELDALIKAKADSDMAQGSVGAQESKSKRSWASPNQIKANQNGTLTNQVQDSLWAGADGLAS